MRCLLIDDDLSYVEEIKEKLETEYQDVTIECYDYLPDVEMLLDEYSVVFLDVMMNDGDSIEYAKQLKGKLKNLILVFISNKNELIFQTQGISPLCFIRKSDLDYDFEIFKILYKEKRLELREYIFELDKSMNKKKISHIKLSSDDIVYVECYLHEIIIHTYANEYVVRMTLKTFMNLVKSQNCFVRIHRTYAVNMNYIYCVDKNRVFMLDDQEKNELEIGRSYKKDFKKTFQKFLL